MIRGKFLMGDTPMWLLMSQQTRFHYMDDIFAVYRISENTASRPNTKAKMLRFQLSMSEMRIFFLKKFNKVITDDVKTLYNERLINYKIFVNGYKEMYPLLDPGTQQLFLYKCLGSPVLRYMLRLRTQPNYLRILFRKVFGRVMK